MTTALRFSHPDLEGGGSGFRVGYAGAVALVHDTLAVRQSLFLLLSTMPGERIRRPDFGCDLNQLMFSTNDETTQGLAIHYVSQAIERWEPRVTLDAVDATAHANQPAVLVVSLTYRLRSSGMEDHLTLDVDLSEGGDTP